jgi:hypothetical protein
MEICTVSSIVYFKILCLTILDSDQFEAYSLIYIPVERSWHSPTSCLWSRASRIGKQFGINTPYEHLEHFFVGGLSIKVPTIGTYVEQLQILVSAEPRDINEVKIIIENINQLTIE